MLWSVRFALLGWASLLSVGCGSSFVPPPPPELVAQSEKTLPPPAKRIELILLADENPERSLWLHLAPSEAGRAKVLLQVSRPKPGEPPARQASLIREAIARGVAALIVEPAEAPEIADALAEAQAKGVVVVLIDRTVPSRGKPFTVVTHEPFSKSARSLVDAVLKDVKIEELSPRGPAILLVNDLADSHTAGRAAALKDALRDAGVTMLDPLTFDGGPANAWLKLIGALAVHPEVDIVLADEHQGLSAAGNVQADKSKIKPIFAGYTMYGGEDLRLGSLPGCAAVADRNIQMLVRKFLKAAVDLAEGKTIPERIEVPLIFHRSE